MITDRNEFPKYDESYDEILAESNKCPEGLKKEILIKNVYNTHYKHKYSLDVHLSEKRKTPLIYDRISRGITYLYQGKYLDNPAYGIYKITKKGKSFIKSGKHLDTESLLNDKDFTNSNFWLRTNSSKNTQNKKGKTINIAKQAESPQEMLERAYIEIEQAKKSELLNYIRNIDAYDFEKVVGSLCEAMGYGTFIETKKSHDKGIDGILMGDSLGFEKIYIQAKRYAEKNIVNEMEMRVFIGALGIVRKAIFFTTSRFAPHAIDKAKEELGNQKEIILIDGEKLVDLMFKYNVGVQKRETYEIKDIDTDFFENL